MTETEKLLICAQDLARRIFEDPSEKAVMDLFQELCAERDRMEWATAERETATMH
ncbi:hypothetical protein [Achromobacter mucicolens]|uniref:hypothetical protein n=1 Tax=Achromobacter mucicolens TaxID=1389922 RepID=UPI00142D4083|nr:hypothetical protein [Achromobacter mucicolens]